MKWWVVIHSIGIFKKIKTTKIKHKTQDDLRTYTLERAWWRRTKRKPQQKVDAQFFCAVQHIDDLFGIVDVFSLIFAFVVV